MKEESKARLSGQRRLGMVLTILGVISLNGIGLSWINYGGLPLGLLLIASSLLLAVGATLLCWSLISGKES